jgi:hypothetical protein
MAIIAEHSALRYGMMVLEHELTFNIKVTGKACRFSICPDNLALVGRLFKVKAARSVTCLASFGLTSFCILFCYVNCYTCMIRELEILVLCGMTILSRTAFRTNVLCPWN